MLRAHAVVNAVEPGLQIGENAIPARLTDNPLISLETAKEKVWKSLEKFGISLEFPWKSLEILGKAWKSLAPRRQATQPLNGPASAGERSPRRAAKCRKIVTQAIENKPSRPKTAPPSVGSAVASAATRCAAPGSPRLHSANSIPKIVRQATGGWPAAESPAPTREGNARGLRRLQWPRKGRRGQASFTTRPEPAAPGSAPSRPT